ncbi:MAG TPA: hypothetical protein VFV10_17885, partial [Gammaproteobacteria bacterium]|nr:hypothetical protein [Gammaproteobacteria bacterium]
QFETIGEAARGCDAIVGATALQLAAPSIAEKLGIPYVFAAYCPAVLPSPRHAPPVLAMRGDAPAGPMADYGELWDRDARRWNETWASALDARRASLGLAPVQDVRGYVLTERPWLAADAALAPWPSPVDSVESADAAARAARRRSSFRSSTTSTIGRGASMSSASAPPTRPARRRPSRSRPRSSGLFGPVSRPPPGPSRTPCAATARRSPPAGCSASSERIDGLRVRGSVIAERRL